MTALRTLEHLNTFILHILGAGGALWGCSEALNVRDTNNATSWRVLSLIASLILVFRAFSVVHQQRRDEVHQGPLANGLSSNLLASQRLVAPSRN